ncbi:MAG: fatty acid cis/trans isomerase [Nitrospiria bacterium]
MRSTRDDSSRTLKATPTGAARASIRCSTNGIQPSPEANRDGSVMYRMLALKQRHSLPPGPILSEKEFDFGPDRYRQCPQINEMGRFEERLPLWDMPLGKSPKRRHAQGTALMSRYIYEHWFVGHFYFDDLPENEYFERVRSATPPGEPIKVIATRR